MPAQRVVRPVVRSFAASQLGDAARYVRQGGHAVVWDGPSRARLLVPAPDEADPMDLALFSILDLGKTRYEIAARGVMKGLATTLVPRDCNDIVRRRIERDRVHRGPTRRMLLDCLDCGACCYANRVELTAEDVTRFEQAGRGDLLRMPYSRRKDGKLVLRLTSDRACLHLESDNRCGVYDIRPEMCRVFPMGSECCLSARVEEHDKHDGARPGVHHPATD